MQIEQISWAIKELDHLRAENERLRDILLHFTELDLKDTRPGVLHAMNRARAPLKQTQR
jgi:hypothetical protein